MGQQPLCDCGRQEAKKPEAELEPAAEHSRLPEEVPNWDALNVFLVRVRMGR
jgi:hypothetical protein